MKKVVEKVSALTKDFAEGLYYSREEIINEYSYDLGVEKTKVKIVKKLLEMKTSINDIVNITELSIEEIEEIIKEYSYDLGKNERNIAIVKNLLRKNFFDEDILEITNITIEQLEEIKNNINN